VGLHFSELLIPVLCADIVPYSDELLLNETTLVQGVHTEWLRSLITEVKCQAQAVWPGTDLLVVRAGK